MARHMYVVSMSADWVTAWATLALAVITAILAIGGIVAAIFAVRTYRAQSEQLKLTKADSSRLRTPILQAQVDIVGPGINQFLRLDVRLSTPEPLTMFQLSLDEARAGDCPVGFTTGQHGVAQNPEQDALPPGWRNDVLRHEASWHEVLTPGGTATFQIAVRKSVIPQLRDSTKIQLRAECSAVGKETWQVAVPVAVTDAAARVVSKRPIS